MAGPILCGFDFTDDSIAASATAARLAARSRVPLVLAHVVDLGADVVYAESRRALARLAADALTLQAKSLAAEHGAEIATEVLDGAPDEALAKRAGSLGASLLVVSALSRRKPPLWRLGGTAARLGRASPVPVLVLRGESIRAIDAWAQGARPLRVLCATDLGPIAGVALRWAATLTSVGPLELVAGYVYWPPQEYGRHGVRGPMPLVGGNPRLEELLARDVRAHAESHVAGTPIEVRVVPGFGRTVDHVVALAGEERADLVVVGTHQREGMGRLWYGSVSYGVLDIAPMSVACVPARAPVQ
jgi:nucleotide-binding universal stress UspA family protein